MGRATAWRLAAEGARVACADSNQDAAAETATRIADAGGDALALVADVTDDGACARMVEAALARFGRLTTLVNSAGVRAERRDPTPPPDEWQRVVDVNLTGTYLASRAALAALASSGSGSITNLASIFGLVGGSLSPAYAASKGGVVNLTRTMALTWAPPTVAPRGRLSPMSTDRTRRAILAGMPLALLAAHPAFRARVWAQAPSTGRLIVQRAVPLAAEMPLSGFGTWITPNDLFHILTTMANPLPAIEPAGWRLAVDGQVEQPITLTYEQLNALPARKIVAVLECAGNSRNSVSPPLERSHLGNGYVGNAEWLGVPLPRVPGRAGLKPSAHEVVLEGADPGQPAVAPGEGPSGTG